MRIDAFRPAADFKKHMDQWIRRFRSAKTVEGQEQVLIPETLKEKWESDRLRRGIPLLHSVSEDLEYLGKRFAVNL